MKRYLLDTHLVYWWMTADTRLGKAQDTITEQLEAQGGCNGKVPQH